MTNIENQEQRKYRVIFQTNIAGKAQHEQVLNNIENVLAEMGDQNITVALVAHGDGIDLLLKQTKLHHDRLKKLAARGVQLLACGITMKRMTITPEELHSFVHIVSSASVEIIKRQTEGWAYIRP